VNQNLLKNTFEYCEGELYWKIKPSVRTNIGDMAGSSKGIYKKVQVFGKTYQIHRLIFMMFNGFFPKNVDHIDGNKLNNRIENLRAATTSQNMCNVKIPSSNTSGIKGVSWHKQRKSWQVQLRVSGKPTYFGLFKDIELAELVILEARNKFHGKFARTV